MLIPSGYRVLVKPDPIEKQTETGIVLVTDEKLERASNMKGTLVAVGEFAWHDYPAPWARVGDRVYYSKYAGKFLTDPEEEENEDGERELYVILNDEDIVAVIRGESK